MSDAINVRFNRELYEQMTANKPTYLSTTDFIHLMADKGLTGCATLGISETLAGSLPLSQRKKIQEEEINHPPGAAKEITSNARAKKQKDPFTSKNLSPDLVPDELQDCADEIVEFWAVKKGTRSEGAATRLFNKLEAMTPADRIKALHAATDAGWSSVYEPKVDSPAHNRAITRDTHPQEFKHPAFRDFTAERIARQQEEAAGKGVLDQLLDS
jgi:hypothetical protein